MTKPRAPKTLEKALVHVADVLPGGFDEMAEVTNHQPWYLRACADPAKREQLSVRDAKLLDKACREQGGGTPIFDHYADQLGAAGALAPADGEDLARHAARVIRECGEAGASLIEAANSSAPAQRAEAWREIQEALEVLQRAGPMLVGREAYDREFAPRPEQHQTGPPRAH